MITSDPRKSEIYRTATLQLRNILTQQLRDYFIKLLKRCERSRWWLTFGYFAMMGAAMPINDAPWYQAMLFMIGGLFALVAAVISLRKPAANDKLHSVPKE